MASWPRQIYRHRRRLGNPSLGLCLSPAGAQQDSYGKVRRLFDSCRHVKFEGLRVIAWRQGIYGPGLVAAGIDGYECGMGTGEQTNVARQQSGRKPHQGTGESGGGSSGIFIETLGGAFLEPQPNSCLITRRRKPRSCVTMKGAAHQLRLHFGIHASTRSAHARDFSLPSRTNQRLDGASITSHEMQHRRQHLLVR